MNIYLENKNENVDEFIKGVNEFKSLSNKLLDYQWPEEENDGENWYCLYQNVLCEMIDNDFKETKDLLDCLKKNNLEAKFYELSRSDAYYEEKYVIGGEIKNEFCVDLHDAVYFDGYDEQLQEEEIKRRIIESIKNSLPNSYNETLDKWASSGALDECIIDGEYDCFNAADVLGNFISEYILPAQSQSKILKQPIELNVEPEEFDEWSF